MRGSTSLILAGLLAGALTIPATSASADPKNGGDHGQWQKHDEHGRQRNFRRHHDYRRGSDNHHGRFDRQDYRRNVKYDNRGHHNKQEIREDFANIRKERNEVREGRQELRGDHKELRKDRAELRRDIRNGASKEEIFQDRQEIRDDYREIRKDRVDLRKDQADLRAARTELKSDLRKR